MRAREFRGGAAAYWLTARRGRPIMGGRTGRVRRPSGRGGIDVVTPYAGWASLLCGRREFLRVGGGLAITGLLSPGPALARPPEGEGQARSCILVYLLGGPPHLD